MKNGSRIKTAFALMLSIMLVISMSGVTVFAESGQDAAQGQVQQEEYVPESVTEEYIPEMVDNETDEDLPNEIIEEEQEPADDELIEEEPLQGDDALTAPKAKAKAANAGTKGEDDPAEGGSSDAVASGSCGANATWTLDDTGKLVISGTGPMYDWTGADGDYPGWYDYCPNITSVVVEEGITSIGAYAFHDSGFGTPGIATHRYVFETISLPDSLESIGERPFDNCACLKHIVVPKNVSQIGDYAFCYCEGLESAVLPEHVDKIGRSTFYYCRKLESVQMPRSVGSWDTTNAFWNCIKLESIVLPEGVTELSGKVFGGCDSLTSAKLPSTLTAMDDSFYLCKSLKQITIPEGVKVIANNTFYGCKDLNAITLPDNLESIGIAAFVNCTNLKSINIPENVTSIGAEVFSNCSSLQELVIPDGVQSLGEDVVRKCTSLETISLPGTLSEIPRLSTRGESLAPAVKKVILHEGTTSIGENAFSSLPALEEINIPSTVKTIGKDAFNGCTKLGAITLPEGIKEINQGTFYGCESMTLPEGFPKSLKNIYDNAFDGCVSLTSLEFSGNLESIEKNAFANCTGLTSVSMMDSRSWIFDYAFANCTNLTDVVLSGRTSSIQNHAFEGCTSLVNITMPAGVPYEDGEGVFAGCTSLKSLDIPLYTKQGNVVPTDYCNGCTNLKEIHLKNGLTAIRDGAFKDCSALTDVYFGGTQEQWNAVTIGADNDILSNVAVHYTEDPVPFGSVLIAPTEHGTAELPMEPEYGSSIPLTVTADEGYHLVNVHVIDNSGKTLDVYHYRNYYAFYLFSEYVTVYAEFEPDTAGGGTEEEPRVITADNCPSMLYDGWYKVTEDTTVNTRMITNGDVHLVLAEGVSMNARMGITVSEGNTLTISGDGTLNALNTTETDVFSAGIGGGYGQKAGTIIINGGTINAAARRCAGIGGACAINSGGYGGTVIINGGTVTAHGGTDSLIGAAGIGGGPSSGGIVTINGGTIHAIGGLGAPGIGGGCNSDGTIADSDITIADGLKVTAKDASAPAQYADRINTCSSNDVTVAPCRHDGEGTISPESGTTETVCNHCGLTVEWFTVTFVDGQGNTLKTEAVVKGNAATQPADPTRDGFAFDGWDKDFSSITSDLTVTAKWKENSNPPTPQNPVSIKDAKVVLSKTAFTYNAKVQKPTIKTIKGLTLKAGTDYTAAWSNASSKNVGTYTVTITGKGNYTGTTKATYKINKAVNPLKISAKTATVKYSKLKKKAQTLAVTKVIKFTKKGQGTMKYTLSSAKKGKKSFKKYFKVNAKTGKVTVKKGLKKGTYKVKVKVKAAGNNNYKASAVKTVTFTVKVK